MKCTRTTLPCLASALLMSLASVAANAQGVHVSPRGVGQVLIFPYFSVRNDGAASASSPENFDTYLSVTNTSDAYKVVRVRAREALRGENVLSFNLFLAPRDVWTAAIVRTAQGARMASNDSSCVVPTTLFKQADGTPTTNGFNDFKNFAYFPLSATDGTTTSLDRTREGHVEVLELGEIADSSWKLLVDSNCAALQPLDGKMSAGLAPPKGGLLGRASLVNVSSGTDFSYDAVALDNWSNHEQYTSAGDSFPDLNGLGGTRGLPSNGTSAVYVGGKWIEDNWGEGRLAARDAVTAALMATEIYNEYNIEAGTASNTDWVVTFPTKHMHVTGFDGTMPFQSKFASAACNLDDLTPTVATRVVAGAKAPFSFAVSNRATRSPSNASTTRGGQFCYNTNVLSFKAGTSKLGSVNSFALDTPKQFGSTATENETGWLSIGFQSQTLTAPSGRKYLGLPAVGFMIEDFTNVNAKPGRVGSYGGLFAHKSKLVVESPN
jgi:hypothetical protein